MELSLSAALSVESVLGHASYFLLVVSMLMRRMILLRIFVIASSITGIIYYGMIMSDPVSIFWETLLISVNIIQLAITAWRNRVAQFTTEEQQLLESHFRALPPSRQRALLRFGTWTDVPAGTILSTEGAPVTALAYLAKGAASVTSGGTVVGHCGAGAFVGEITVARGGPASGTVTAETDLRVWRVDAEAVRRILGRHSDLAAALEAAFFVSISTKLVQNNRRLAETGLVAGS